MAAIGRRLAVDLLRHHDHTATTHEPIKHLLAAGGKLLVIGCTVSSPGFSTVHYVYEELGLATRSLLSGLIGCYFKSGTATPWFRQRDVPGCSLGFHKFYPLYRAKFDAFAKEWSGDCARPCSCDQAADAVAVEREAVHKSPAFSLCDNPQCFSCRGTKWFNAGDMPRYYLSQVPRTIFRRLTRGRR